jgi:hypothetical protein
MWLRRPALRYLEKHGIWTGLSPDPALEPRRLLIHIPKNGGMTVRRAPALKRRVLVARPNTHKTHAYSKAVLRTMTTAGEHHGFEHARVRDIKLEVRRMLPLFAVVRNPWSRVVSRFHFALAAMKTGTLPPDYAAHDFEAFLEERHVWGGTDYYWHRAIRGWYPQVDYVVDEEGRMAADILRLENLDEETSRYLGLDRNLERRGSSGSGWPEYQSYYDARKIQIIADWYAVDIATFGFDFDTPARRNCLYAD